MGALGSIEAVGLRLAVDSMGRDTLGSQRADEVDGADKVDGADEAEEADEADGADEAG